METERVPWPAGRQTPLAWLNLASAARLLAGWLVFLALVQVLTIAASLAEIAITQGVAVGILLLAGAGGVSFGRLVAAADDDPIPYPEAHPSASRLVSWLAATLLALLALALAGSLLHPYFHADCVIYHLPAIHYWGERGFVHWIGPEEARLYYTDSFINAYPKAGELVSFVVIHATGVGTLVHWLNVWFLPLGALGVVTIALRLGAGAPAALAAGLAYALAPVNLQQMGSTYVDSAYSSALVALLAVLVLVASTPAEGALPWTMAVAFGAAAGLVLGVKGSGPLAVALAGAALLGLAAAWVWSGGTGKRGARTIRALSWSALALVVALAVGGYWYARNAVHMGNPVYPLGVRVGTLIDWPGEPMANFIQEEANLPMDTAGWSDWRRVAYVWLQGGPGHWPLSVCSVSARLGGLGLVWLLGCIPSIALALAACRKGRFLSDRRRPVVVLLAVTLLAFALTPMHWWARYTVWLLGAGLPCLAVVLERWSRGRTRVAARAWLGVLLVAFLVETGVGVAWLVDGSDPDWFGGSTPFPEPASAAFEALTWRGLLGLDERTSDSSLYDEIMASRKPVLLGPLDIADVPSVKMMFLFGWLCDPLGQRPVRFLKPSDLASPDDLVRQVSEQRIRYVVWDLASPLPPVPAELVVREESNDEFRFFAIDPSRVSGGLPRGSR